MSQIQVTGEAKIRTLTGALTATAGVVTSVPLGAANGVATLGTDGKVPSAQLPTLGSSYKGTWNAATNTPYIVDGVGTAGDYYLVSTGGTWNGIVFVVGNTVIYSGTIWQRAGGGTGTVTSVGLSAPAAFSITGSPITGAGTLAIAGAGTANDYIKGDGTLGVFSSAAVASITGGASTIATSNLDTSKALNSNSSGKVVANVTTATELAYLSGVTSNVQTQLDGKGPSYTLGSVSSSPTSVLVITGSGAPVNGSLTFTVNLASGSQNGYLSSTDWTTFNNKQNALGFTPYNATNPDGFINSSGTAAAVSRTVSGTNTAELVRGNMADNDQFRILVGGTGSNAGYVEIATADDGTEPIYVRQYTGVFSSITRTATLLDSSGNTSFPNNLSAANFSGSSSGTNTGDQTLAGLGGQPQLNGTGFVKASGTSISYDNSTYLTTSSAASTYLTISNAASTYFPFSGGTITGATNINGLLTNYNVYNTQTSSYTLVLADASKIVEMNVGSANTVTVPTNSSVAFPIGTEITVMQYGAGNTTIVAASGVTFRSKDFSTRIGDQYTGATLIKRDTNEWYLIGNIQP
jgi:hypothetical protein